MTVRLRPHHLLCLVTYAGKGYTPAFTENFDLIVERLRGGEAIAIVEGPDDICQPWLGEPDAHCRRDSVALRDEKAAQDLGTLLGADIHTVSALPDLATLRAAFAKSVTRQACAGCEWFDLCSDIAAGGYRATNFLKSQA